MKKHWPFFLLVLLTVFFFIPDITGGKGFLFGDNLSQRIPTLNFYKQEILSRRFPLWNPYILSGIPFFADLSNNVLAPTNFFYLVLTAPQALTFLVIFYISFSAVFTYLFTNEYFKSKTVSLFSAIIFSFSGSIIASVNDINSLQGIAFIPAVFFAAETWMKKKNLKYLLTLIGMLSLQFISSHPQYSYYTWMMLIPYMLVMKKKYSLNPLNIISIFVSFLGLVSIQLIPFLELSSNVYRPESLEFSTQNQLQIIELPKFILANFYGNWRSGSSWGPGSQIETGLANTEGYTGFLPLFFVLISVLTNKDKVSRFWFAVLLFSLLISLGNQTIIYNLLYSYLPLFSKFRSPVRILALYSFSISILAGFGLLKLKKEIEAK